MSQSWIFFLPKTVRSWLVDRPVFRKVVANTGWLFTEKVIRMGLGLVIMAWMARYLGPEQFGILNYAIAFVALFTAFATLGLDQIVVRDIVNNPQCKDEILGTGIFLKFAGGGMVLVLSLLSVYFTRPGDTLSFWLVGILAAGILFQSFDIIDFWFQSQLRSRYTVWAKTAAFLAASIGKGILIVMQAPLIAFAWITSAEMAMGAAGLVLAYNASGGFFKRWRGNLKRAKALLSSSWPLLLGGIFVMLYMRVDQVMLREMATESEVGYYSVAVSLVGALYALPLVITSSLFPVIVESRRLDPEVYEARMQKLYDLLVWTAILAAVFVSVLSVPIIILLFGEAYRAAGLILGIQMWLGPSVFFNFARSKWLVAEGFQRANLQINVIGFLVNIPLNFILIPPYGAVGATIASLIAIFAANLIPLFFSEPIRVSTAQFVRSVFLPARALKGLF